MYAAIPQTSVPYAPTPYRPTGYATPGAPTMAPAPSPFGRDAFVPSSSYQARPAFTPPAVLSLEDIPGTPERMKLLSKQVMAPYFEAISSALRYDPEVSMAVTYGVYSDAQKLRLVERVKQIVSGIYNLPPIATQVLDEPWVGGGYSFDQNYLYTITTGLLKDATPGDLIYLTVHEMTHAFQHRMVDFPLPPGGGLGELTAMWRGNTPQAHGYLSYEGEETFRYYAEQPLEFSAFLGGNFVEYQVTGRNSRLWGTSETEAWDLYA